MDAAASQGVTWFKAYMHITPEELQAAINEAHGKGLKVTGHLCSIGFKDAADMGINGLEHGIVVDTEFFRPSLASAPRIMSPLPIWPGAWT